MSWVEYGTPDFGLQAPFGRRTFPQDYGFDLPSVYLLWLVVVLLLYPACRWFASVKRRRRDAWLSYLSRSA